MLYQRQTRVCDHVLCTPPDTFSKLYMHKLTLFFFFASQKRFTYTWLLKISELDVRQQSTNSTESTYSNLSLNTSLAPKTTNNWRKKKKAYMPGYVQRLAPLMENVRKERRRGNQMWWWVRKSWLYKASGCWPFYSSHTKGLQKHHRRQTHAHTYAHTLRHTHIHAHTHKHTGTHTNKCSHTSWKSGWHGSDMWCVNEKSKYILRCFNNCFFVVSVHPMWNTKNEKRKKKHKSHSLSMTTYGGNCQ